MDVAAANGGAMAREIKAAPDTLLNLAARLPNLFPVLLDSAAQGPHGRWSILAAYPRASLRLLGDGSLHHEGVLPRSSGFLDTLDRWWHEVRSTPSGDELPFHGGWMLFLGYELARECEPGLAMPAPTDDETVAMALRVPAALLFDHRDGRCHAVAEASALHLLDALEGWANSAGCGHDDAGFALRSVLEEPPHRFLDGVVRAQRAIAAGDLYQLNLSREWQIELQPGSTDEALYRALRTANPAPFAAWWQHPYLRLMSSSPERLVSRTGHHVSTRPIAGTRPRSCDPQREQAELRELLTSEKERAEHVMLIDLERNDLGRFCVPGSVRVDECMVTESYRHVHHIVSGVSGTCRADTSPSELLRAVFPGGTITGCPKYRCMQRIGELEQVPRGAYTGAVGYLDRNGNLDCNILIRTLVRRADRLSLRAGAGLVADSVPERELDETRAKARGLLRALGIEA